MKIYTANDTKQCAQDLLNGALLALPTDTVYGLGVIYGRPDTLNRLKQAKGRPETKPVPMMVSDLKYAESFAVVDERTRKIAHKLLPGALTLILPLKPEADRFYTNGADTVALRIPDSPVLLEVMEKAGAPIMLTSCNHSGEPAALSFEEVCSMDLDYDGILKGECKAGLASTIIDCTKKDLAVLRQGPIDLYTVQAALES